MSIKEDLNSVVSKWSLLKHPFYQAWSAGTLPVDDLRTYAREYGVFIELLPSAWTALKDKETAEEEREHAALWADFAAALGTGVNGAPETSIVGELGSTADRLFKDPATAAGALYAFEVQQPETAESKLAGLRQHYKLPVGVEPYFEIHSHNQHEAAKLLARIEDLPENERTRSLQACGEMAEALWNALSDIYGEDRMSGC